MYIFYFFILLASLLPQYISPMAYLKNLRSYVNRSFSTRAIHKPAPTIRKQPKTAQIPWYTRIYRSLWSTTPKVAAPTTPKRWYTTPLQPIQPAVVPPAVTEKAAIAKIAEQAMTEIKEDHEKAHLPLTEKSLIICTQPGINSALLLEFDSIEAIQSYLKKRYHQFDLEYKKIMRMTDKDFAHWLGEQKEIDNYVKNMYKQPDPQVLHSKGLPNFILKETKRLLALVGINPLTVNIMDTVGYKKIIPDIRLPESQACISSPVSRTKDRIYIHKPGVWYNTNRINNIINPKPLVTIIAHEVGHLMYHHVQGSIHYPSEGANEVQNVALTKLHHEFDLLHELEADIAVALIDKDIAQTIHEYLSELLASPDTFSTTNKDRGNMYQSSKEFYHWIQRINELHKKE